MKRVRGMVIGRLGEGVRAGEGEVRERIYRILNAPYFARILAHWSL